MSRAAQSKSRAEKKGGQSAPTPAVTHEIVPGKFTDVDWNRMIELDDGEEFISDIVDELLSGTLAIIYQKYIERQLLPYTISQAREAILTIVDWRFLTSDVGEADTATDVTWRSDEEAQAAVPDCWAQGSVPKTFTSVRPPSVASIREESASHVEDPQPDLEWSEAADSSADQQNSWEPKIEDMIKLDTLPASEEAQDQAESMLESSAEIRRSKIQPEGKKKRKFVPHKGRLKSAGLNNLTETLEDTERRLWKEEQMKRFPKEQDHDKVEKPSFDPMPHSVASILKPSPAGSMRIGGGVTESTRYYSCGTLSTQLQPGRPPGSRDVYYDANGTVIAMAKINSENLPTHRIKTKFYVVDPRVEAAQSRLDAMRTGRYLAGKTKSHAPSSDKTKLDKSNTLDYRSVNSQVTGKSKHVTHTQKSAVTPLPPPMIESIELAPGVVVREGDRVKRGPRQLVRNIDHLPSDELLRPIGENLDVTVSVRELLENSIPRVRIHESLPVPPIVPKNNAWQKIAT